MMSNLAGECIRKIRPSPAMILNAWIVEQPDEPAVTVPVPNLPQPIDLRRHDFDAGDAFDLGPARDPVNRISRSEPDDGDFTRVWV